MKSKNKKIQNLLTKGIAIFIVIAFIMSSFSVIQVTLADDEETEILEEVVDTNFDALSDTETALQELTQSYEELLKELQALNSSFDYNAFARKIVKDDKTEITSEDELRALAVYVAAGGTTSGKIFTITKNIALTDTMEWNPIGNSSNPFEGTLDGAGHTITGILLTKKQSYLGFIGYLKGGTIKNLTIGKSSISIPAEVDNINNNDLISTERVNYSYLGAIAGYATNNATISNCKNTVDITGGNLVGGIVGQIVGYGNTISDCSNTGTVRGMTNIGGIVGAFTNASTGSTTTSKITRTYNTGKVHAIAANAGGIAGNLYGNVTLSDSMNSGAISVSSDIITLYINAEKTTYTPQNVGGIAGWVCGYIYDGGHSDLTIKNCINTKGASTSGYQDIGGIAGQLGGWGGNTQYSGSSYATIDSCYNYSDNISCGRYTSSIVYAGKIAGAVGSRLSSATDSTQYLKHNGIIKNSSYYTTVSSSTVTSKENKSYSNNGNFVYLGCGYLTTFLKAEGTTKVENLNITTVQSGNSIDATAPELKGVNVKNSGAETLAIKGDTLTITFTFDEPINLSRTTPVLKLFNEKYATYYGIGSDKKSIIFTYTLDGTESGTTENLYLTSNTLDVFNNKNTMSSSTSIDSDLMDKVVTVISSDNVVLTSARSNIAYSIEGSHLGSDGNLYFNREDIVKVIVTFPGNVTNGLTDASLPTLKIKIGGTVYTINATSDNSGSKIIYNFNTKDYNGQITEMYLSGSTLTCTKPDSTSNSITLGTGTKVDFSDYNMYIDSIAPAVTIAASVNEANENSRYTTGKEITITVTSSEAIDVNKSIRPEINVSFSESGLGKYNYQGENATTGNAIYVSTIKNTDTNGNVTYTYKYKYVIADGDEGTLSYNYANENGKIIDIAGNKISLVGYPNDATTSIKKVEGTLSEGTAVTYQIYKNGTEIKDFSSNTYFADGDTIKVIATIGDSLYKSYGSTTSFIDNTTAPKLKINGISSDIIGTVSNSGKKITYNYTIDGDDDTRLTGLSLTTGNVVYIKGIEGNYTTINAGNINTADITDANLYICNNGTRFANTTIYADTALPTVEIIAKDVNNNVTNKDTVTYEFKWSEELINFDANKITVTNGTKGTLSGPIKNEDGTYSYTMAITNNVAKGNTGELQVIVEQDAAQDLVYQGNVRRESIIAVDKIAPILISLESYATSNIDVDEGADTVKQYYKVGDTVTVVATFSENITGTAPELALQFSESGNTKGTVTPGVIDGNRVTYTYRITEGDKGTLSVKGFKGKVIDKAGNETVVTKRILDGDTIIADTESPELIGLTAIAPEFEYDELVTEERKNVKKYGVESKTRDHNTITIIATYSEDIYKLDSNTITVITDSTKPTLGLRFSQSGNAKGTVKFQKVEENQIYYTYDVTNGDNGDLSIISLNGTVSDIAGNTYTTSTSLPTLVIYEANIADSNEVEKITVDTKKPSYTITAKAEDRDDNDNRITGNGNYYRKGSILTITATTDKYVYKNDNKNLTEFTKENAPTLAISFEAKGTGVGTCTDVKYENNRTIFTYTYSVKENDNGTLKVAITENAGYDIALNGNNSKTQTISSIIADTVYPVTNFKNWVETEKYGIVDHGNGTWTVTFSERLYNYNINNQSVGSSVTTSSAPVLKISKDGGNTDLVTTISNITTSDDKTVITYTYSPYTKNLEATGFKYNGYVSDKAGNLFNDKDHIAPTLSNIRVTSPASGTYKAGEEITVVATYSEKITGTAPVLTLKFGNEDAKGTVSGGTVSEKTITYTYTITEGDNGKLAIGSFTGGSIKDLYDNEWEVPTSVTLGGNTIVADTTSPIVTIISNKERTNEDKVVYTFSWSEDVTGFEIGDIEVTNGLKGTFTKVNNRTYTLEVDTTNEGRQIVKVNANVCTDIAGNPNEARATYNQVVIDYTKPEMRAKVNGGNYVMDTDSKKSTLKEIIVVNEELSKFEYAWSKETTEPTSGWTTVNPATIEVNSDITITKEADEIGTYYLYVRATDLAGNVLSKRTQGFVVNNAVINLTPNTTEKTKEDVTVTVSYGIGLTENKKAGVQGRTQSADPSVVIITENGTVYAEATDTNGNKVYKTLKVENIDKIAPTATISYKTNADGSVTATITLSDGKVTNNSGKRDYVFTENGEFTFEFEDEVGNKGTATAKVTSIKEKVEDPEEDKTAPEVTLNYVTTTAKVGDTIGATITTNEDAKIAYSWDNQNWTTSNDFVRSMNVTRTGNVAGTYTLYAKAVDKAGNESEIKTVTFTIVANQDNKDNADIVFDTDNHTELVTLKVDDIQYVRVPLNYTTSMLTAAMKQTELKGKTPTYSGLTSAGGLRTSTEIKLDGVTKYIVVINGDINCDGKVDFTDIIRANAVRINGTENSLSKAQLLAADLNMTGKIEFRDIITINGIRISSTN